MCLFHRQIFLINSQNAFFDGSCRIRVAGIFLQRIQLMYPQSKKVILKILFIIINTSVTNWSAIFLGLQAYKFTYSEISPNYWNYFECYTNTKFWLVLESGLWTYMNQHNIFCTSRICHKISSRDNKLKSFQGIEVTRALYLYWQNFHYQLIEIKLNVPVVLWLQVINIIPVQMQSAF